MIEDVLLCACARRPIFLPLGFRLSLYSQSSTFIHRAL